MKKKNKSAFLLGFHMNVTRLKFNCRMKVYKVERDIFGRSVRSHISLYTLFNVGISLFWKKLWIILLTEYFVFSSNFEIIFDRPPDCFGLPIFPVFLYSFIVRYTVDFAIPIKRMVK